MKRTEILAEYLGVLDDINQSLHYAIETLKENAATTRMLIDEIVNGAFEENNDPYAPSMDFINAINKEEPPVNDYIVDDVEALSDQIVKRIREGDSSFENGFHAIDIVYDPEKIDPHQLMKLVKEKMNKEKIETKPKKEDISDEYKFENPLE